MLLLADLESDNPSICAHVYRRNIAKNHQVCQVRVCLWKTFSTWPHGSRVSCHVCLLYIQHQTLYWLRCWHAEHNTQHPQHSINLWCGVSIYSLLLSCLSSFSWPCTFVISSDAKMRGAWGATRVCCPYTHEYELVDFLSTYLHIRRWIRVIPGAYVSADVDINAV